MAITQQMVLIRMEDIAVYAEARNLVRLATALQPSSPARAGVVHDLRLAAHAVAATVAEGLRAWSCEEEVRRLREAVIALCEVRSRAYEALESHVIEAAAFDELVAAAARCAREVDRAEVAARHRGRRRLEHAA